MAPNINFMNEEVSTGTTVLACEYNGGVMIAADSRTTTGSYVFTRVSNKLTKLTDKIYCCRSGSAADTQALADIVSYHLDLYSMELEQEPSVSTAAALFQNLSYNYREQLTAGVIVAGWDKKKGPQVYIITIGGMKQKLKMAMSGSGSTFIYGYLDQNFKENMTHDECKSFLMNAIKLAIYRDGSSGGIIRLGWINKDMEAFHTEEHIIK